MINTILSQDILHSAYMNDAFLLDQQALDGGFRIAPDARILENGLTLLLCKSHLSPRAIASAHAAVVTCPPQTHCDLARNVDEFLRTQMEYQGGTLRMDSPDWHEPAAKHRRLFFAGLGHALGWTMIGAPSREAVEATLLAAVSRKNTREMKKWTLAECCALLILLGHKDESLCALITQTQDPGGSFGLNPLSTAIVVAALATVRWQAPQAFAAGIGFLESEIIHHSSWRFAMAEVWDTALLLRVLNERKWQAAKVTTNAAHFVRAAQNADGGWPYRQGVESDTDTTGMALHALYLGGDRSGADAAVSYLRARQTPQGLWRTWHDSEDPPAEDAIAHAVIALRALGHDEMCKEAKRFLVEQCQRDRGWSAHWYNSETYSASEIGAALGRQHPITRFGAQLVLQNQRTDGGWAPTAGRESTAAATGMALAFLSDFLAFEDERVQAGLSFLCRAQSKDGRFVGATDMYAPRPFAVDYAAQTQALALSGITRWANKMMHPRAAERRAVQARRDTSAYLSVDFDQARSV